MKATLLSAAAALVLTSAYSVSSFAQHDDEDAYRAPDGVRTTLLPCRAPRLMGLLGRIARCRPAGSILLDVS